VLPTHAGHEADLSPATCAHLMSGCDSDVYHENGGFFHATN
jgi:hypothetical protein